MRVVQHDDLKAPSGGSNFLAEHRKDLSYGGNVLVSPFGSWAILILSPRSPLWKIHLAGLVKHKEARNRVIDVAQKEFLQSNDEGNVISKPIRAAADLR